MNIIEAIENEQMFRPCFKDLSTWSSWLTLLRAFFGLEMDEADMALFRQCTGRDTVGDQAKKELWCICGRRGGKSFMSAIIAVYLSLYNDYKSSLAPGERGTVQVVAADRAQALVILEYIKGVFASNPVFSQYVQSELRESISLTNNITIEVMSCSYRSVRGRTVVCAIFDEISFWRIEGANPDTEILGAVRPSMATIADSKLIVISSPYARSGVLYEHHRDYFGKDEPDLLVWQADTRTMNPTIPQELIDRETIKDPNAARAEWQALFRDDIETFLNPELVDLCAVLPDTTPPDKYTLYQGFVDSSGGRADAFTVAVGHHEEGLHYIDLVYAWTPPFSPDDVVKEIVQVLRGYRITRVTGDRYAGSWVSASFEKHKINYTTSEVPKSSLYLGLEPFINAATIKFPKDKHLITELVNLERKRGRAGKDVVDHPPRGSDDMANALAGVCHLLTKNQSSAFAGLDLT